MSMYYRLNPHLNNGKCASMFDVAELAGVKLITGRGYGDDYINAPAAEADRNALEELMRADGIFFEAVERLPSHLSYHADQ